MWTGLHHHLSETMSDGPIDDVQAAVADDAEVLSSGHGEALALERTELHLLGFHQRERAEQRDGMGSVV